MNNSQYIDQKRLADFLLAYRDETLYVRKLARVFSIYDWAEKTLCDIRRAFRYDGYEEAAPDFFKNPSAAFSLVEMTDVERKNEARYLYRRAVSNLLIMDSKAKDILGFGFMKKFINLDSFQTTRLVCKEVLDTWGF